MAADKKTKTQLAVIVTIIMACVVCLWIFVLFPESKKKIDQQAPPTVGEAIREVTNPSEEKTEEEKNEEELEAVKQQVEEERRQEAEEMKSMPRLPLSEEEVEVDEGVDQDQVDQGEVEVENSINDSSSY